jgi:glutathionyl-hydroquinone reductase
MTREEISKVVREYIEQYKFGAMYREELRLEIDKYEKLISDSFNKNIYMLIYKREYGAYRDFVETVAKALREGTHEHQP